MAVNYLNEIISIFLHRNVDELGDEILSTTIERKGHLCPVQNIRQVVQSSGSSLFQLWCNKDGKTFVRLQPKVRSLSHLCCELFRILDKNMSRFSSRSMFW